MLNNINLVIFGYYVLEQENLNNWSINIVEGNEGFCHRGIKLLNIGDGAVANNNYKLMLHEIAHILTYAYHYSDEFESIVKRLNKKYIGE